MFDDILKRLAGSFVRRRPRGLSTEESIDSLCDLLRQGDEAAKCNAADRLGDLGPAAAAAVPALTEALRDPGEDTEEITYNDGGGWGGDVVEYRTRYVRERAIRALARIRPADTTDVVIPVMVELIERLKMSSTSGGGQEHLQAYIEFSPEEVRAFGPRAVEAMLEAYRRHPDPYRSEAMVRALSGHRG
jgi:hypothetical protein